MPWESVGDCGTGQLPNERDLVVAQLELGIKFLELFVGDPPEDCELGLMWHEHDYGPYPTIGLTWEVGELGTPEWKYIARCENALSSFDDAIDWADLDEVWESGFEDEDADEDKDEVEIAIN